MCAVKNEKGVTLIELLGVLVILSIVLTLAGSILTSSLKTSNRATADQRLQQEANYITEAIRNKYLGGKEGTLTIQIEDDKLLLIEAEESKIVISEGYHYTNHGESEIKLDKSYHLHILIQTKDENSSYEIHTKLSKLK